MFKKIFIDLCNQKGVSPSAVCRQVGLSNAAYSTWTDKTVPRQATLYRIAEYFNVSPDYLIGETDQKENAPTPCRNECEEKILEQFRKLSADEQEAFLKLIDALTKSNDKPQ